MTPKKMKTLRLSVGLTQHTQIHGVRRGRTESLPAPILTVAGSECFRLRTGECVMLEFFGQGHVCARK